ncbi:MAG: hypothetical protein KatS3mg077_1401 [Candidatus Binatia bacterium]|nr:MAG: hypothetical protein KatS3mg077_1401 [Candidatus Binatia bacterium]
MERASERVGPRFSTAVAREGVQGKRGKGCFLENVWPVLATLVVGLSSGCASHIRVAVPPADLSPLGEQRAAKVTLWIDPRIAQGEAGQEFRYATLRTYRVVVPYGPGLGTTIRQAAASVFASVNEGDRCKEGSSAFIRVEWAGEPAISVGWDEGFREGARGSAEFPLRLIVSDCQGKVLARRTIVGAYVGPGASPGMWNTPSADDFAPILAAALRDTGAKLISAFTGVPLPAAPVASN